MKDIKQFLLEKHSAKSSGVDYLVHVIAIGKVAPNTGKTKYGWSVYEEHSEQNYLYFVSRSDKEDATFGTILYGAKDSLKVGDVIELVDNDTQKKCAGLANGVLHVLDVCESTHEEFIKMAKKHGYFSKTGYIFNRTNDYKTKQSKWANLSVWYSIKGVED